MVPKARFGIKTNVAPFFILFGMPFGPLRLPKRIQNDTQIKQKRHQKTHRNQRRQYIQKTPKCSKQGTLFGSLLDQKGYQNRKNGFSRDPSIPLLKPSLTRGSEAQETSKNFFGSTFSAGRENNEKASPEAPNRVPKGNQSGAKTNQKGNKNQHRNNNGKTHPLVEGPK